MTISKFQCTIALSASVLLSACGSGAIKSSSSEEASSLSSTTSSELSSSSVTESSSESSSLSSSSNASDDTVVLYAVNAGGTSYTSEDGIEFTGDHYFSGGNTGTTTDYIQDTQDQALFNTERWGEFTYEFPLVAGTYDVTLYFAETWFGPSQTGNRVFDVNIEDVPYVDDFDPLASVGHDVAHSVEFVGIVVSDGHMSFDFIPTIDQASLRAIVIRGAEGSVVDEEPVNTGTVGDGPIPGDCPQTASAGDSDFVLFDGSNNVGPMVGSTIELHQSWMLDEAWAVPDGANLELSNTADGAAIQYSNAGIFTGFKFTPPLNFGERRSFYLSGVDLYIQGSSGAQFGLRVIKPGEFEGNGGASTTTWVRNAQGQQDLALSQNCSLLSLAMPSNWDVNSQEANRFILEVKNGWNNSSQLQVRRIVIKGFDYAN